MKILHLSLSCAFSDGFNYHENELPYAQLKLGNDVVIVARNLEFKNGVAEKCSPGNFVLANGIRLYRLKIKNFFVNSFTRPKTKELMDILRKENPDVIWVHGIMNNSLSIVCKYKRTNKKTIIVADNHVDEGNYGLNFLSKVVLWIFKKRNQRVANNVSIFYGVTPGRLSFMRKYLGVPYEKSKLTTMGANPDTIDYKNKENIRAKIRNELGIMDSDFLYITGGKIDYQKRTIDLIKAISFIKEENIKLLIFGSLDESIKEEFNEMLKNSNNVMYLGWKNVKEYNDLFISSDCGIFLNSHSTLWENALACGTPCIFGIKEGLDHLFSQNLGFFFDSKEHGELSLFLKTFAFSSKYHELLNDSNVKRNNYSYDVIAKKTINDLNEVRND